MLPPKLKKVCRCAYREGPQQYQFWINVTLHTRLRKKLGIDNVQ